MKKLNFILFASALLSLGAYQLQATEAAPVQEKTTAVSEESAVKKQVKEEVVSVAEKTEVSTTAPVATEKKADTSKNCGCTSTKAQKK